MVVSVIRTQCNKIFLRVQFPNILNPVDMVSNTIPKADSDCQIVFGNETPPANSGNCESEIHDSTVDFSPYISSHNCSVSLPT